MAFQAEMTHKFVSPPAQFPILDRRNVHVWMIDLKQKSPIVGELFLQLSEDEQARANRFIFDRDRHRFIETRWSLRYLLSKYIHKPANKIEIANGHKGKPYIIQDNTPTQVKFNVSHSGAAAIIAFCLGDEIGIDIEKIRPEVATEEIARRHFSKCELDELSQLPPDQQTIGFFRCWTRKEAYLKAIGIGLGIDLRSFDVSLGAGDTADLRTADGHKWKLIPFSAEPDYIGALVCSRDKQSIQYLLFDYLLKSL